MIYLIITLISTSLTADYDSYEDYSSHIGNHGSNTKVENRVYKGKRMEQALEEIVAINRNRILKHELDSLVWSSLGLDF